ncbi:hypothetical protein QZH41_014516 [Actinostola sp. cb2023]|nr:hypothetical protein QZH41_014516 [Actinostola sp. cb2023]
MTSRTSPSAHFTAGPSTSKASRPLINVEDLFNYLYGYTPIRLVDPVQLQRERAKLAQLSDTSKEKHCCDLCNEKHDGECPMHGPLHSLRKLVTTGHSQSPLENGTILKFPDEVCLCTSSIPCVTYGVCACKRILAGTWIGPYEGKLVRPEDINKDTDTQFMWEVFHDGQVSHYLDGKEEANASWMRYVRCARHKKEQNMVVFQYHGCVYYRTIRDIMAGQELLVWYDGRYSQFMGVPVALSDSGSRGVQPPRDLVAQRSRERTEVGEPSAKRPTAEHVHAQRGRPPLRRSLPTTEIEQQPKSEPLNHIVSEEKKDERKVVYRGRPAYTTSKTVPRNTIRVEIEDEFTWRCNLCFKAFAVREQLEEHQCNGLSSAKNLICPHCNQSFSHPVEFRHHVESHANERPFRCGYCTRAFSNAALLNQHVRVHIAESTAGKLGLRHDRASHEFQY